MAKPGPFSDLEKMYISEAYSHGTSLSRIAKALGRSRQGVTKYVRAAGIEPVPRTVEGTAEGVGDGTRLSRLLEDRNKLRALLVSCDKAADVVAVSREYRAVLDEIEGLCKGEGEDSTGGNNDDAGGLADLLKFA